MPRKTTTRRTRTATGGTPRISAQRDAIFGFRLPAHLIEQVDLWANANAVPSRTEAVRRLLEQALAAVKRR